MYLLSVHVSVFETLTNESEQLLYNIIKYFEIFLIPKN